MTTQCWFCKKPHPVTGRRFGLPACDECQRVYHSNPYRNNTVGGSLAGRSKRRKRARHRTYAEANRR